VSVRDTERRQSEEQQRVEDLWMPSVRAYNARQWEERRLERLEHHEHREHLKVGEEGEVPLHPHRGTLCPGGAGDRGSEQEVTRMVDDEYSREVLRHEERLEDAA
jgi:hypothetical protein